MNPRDEQSAVGKAQEVAERAANFSLQDAADRVSEVGERMQLGIEEVNQQVRSVVGRINFDETTIPDAFRKCRNSYHQRSIDGWTSLSVGTSWGSLSGSRSEERWARPLLLS